MSQSRGAGPEVPLAAGGLECPGDEVKLIDFGLSRLRGEMEAGRPRGALVGSPYYAAPEQEADPERADERADLFSAGVTLFRCLTGRLPQEGVAASALRQGLDGRFDAFFARCCHEERTQRPASARALLAELDELAAHWRRLKAAACVLSPEQASEPAPPPPAPGPLRGEALRQPLAGARARFGLDELWRPLASRPERFRLEGDVVRDAETGLVWQRGGSPYALSHAQAQAYARGLDAGRFAGRGGWRLPTAEELSTLLLPEPDLRRLCLPGVFAPEQRRLWSADRKSFMAAWYVDVEHGFVWWQDSTCEFFARCVSSEG